MWQRSFLSRVRIRTFDKFQWNIKSLAKVSGLYSTDPETRNDTWDALDEQVVTVSSQMEICSQKSSSFSNACFWLGKVWGNCPEYLFCVRWAGKAGSVGWMSCDQKIKPARTRLARSPIWQPGRPHQGGWWEWFPRRIYKFWILQIWMFGVWGAIIQQLYWNLMKCIQMVIFICSVVFFITFFKTK